MKASNVATGVETVRPYHRRGSLPPSIPAPGTYVLAVTAPGFKNALREKSNSRSPRH